MDNDSEPKPRYGEYPLDCYGIVGHTRRVQKHWDFTRPATDDGEQWKRLVLAYLQLGRRERVPYHAEAIDTEDRVQSTGGGGPPEEVVSRCLGPFQTVWERNSLASQHNTWYPIMVRTHYGADLEEAYDALVQPHIIEDRELNDRALYDGLDTAQLLLRLPQLVDQQTAHIIEDAEHWEIADREGSPPYEELAEDSFDKAVRYGQSILLVADREAMETQQILVKWLDLHGRCVWESRVHSDELEDLNGLMKDGNNLSDFQYEGIVNGGRIG